MFEFHLLDFKNVVELYYQYGVFKGIAHDEASEIDIANELLNHPSLVQVSLDGNFLGFFSMDHKDINGTPAVEAHAYFLPYSRKYAMKAIKSFTELLHEQYKYVITGVNDLPETKHVNRVLSILGYEEVDHVFNIGKRDGIEFARTFYIHIKE